MHWTLINISERAELFVITPLFIIERDLPQKNFVIMKGIVVVVLVKLPNKRVHIKREKTNLW